MRDRLSHRSRFWFELTVSYTLVLVTLWTAGPLQRVFFWTAAVWFFWLVVFRPLGRVSPLPFAARLRIGALMVAAGSVLALAVIALGWLLGTLHDLFGTSNPLLHATEYVVWALIQQLLQQQVFFSRIEQLAGSGAGAVLVTAILVGLAHIPNPVLAPVTFLGGWALTECYRRYRVLVPLGIVHGLVGLAIALAVPNDLHHHMRVGLGYLRYGRPMI